MMQMLNTHLPALPVLLPAITAIVMLWLGDHTGGHGHRRLLWGRRISTLSVTLGLVVAVLLFMQADAGELRVYRMGDWPAPFGIVLVIDRLSAFMLLLTQLVAWPVIWYAAGGWDAHGRHFHALFHFQLMGLGGAFVTGDLFNLFVFFEVLLIASYVLLMHGQGRERFRVGVHYVVLNLAASALFLIGIALLYALTGTLNMADLALRVAEVEGDEAAVLQAGALILLVVFGFKAALLPLSQWLPSAYASACAPVAALFAIMTKVGIYGIVRVHGVIFGSDAGASALLAGPWLLPLALATSVFGVLGAMAAHSLGRLVAYLTVASAGTALLAIGLFSPAAWSAALYYTAHSTLVVAGLFLLVELVSSQRGDAADRLVEARPVAQPALLGIMLLFAAASVSGVPPLPGFVGKLMIMHASGAHPAQVWVWTSLLLVGFFSILCLARAGAILFWSTRAESDRVEVSPGASPRLVAATVILLALSIAMTVYAVPLKRYTDAAAEQLNDREAYSAAVLGSERNAPRPYRASGAGESR